jgi:protein-S-isoprenylcysteine O-methyltransferase Ste14
MSDIVLRYVLIAWVFIAVAVFISLFFVAAPYGRYFRQRFGPSINGKIGWIIMESPAPLVFAAFLVADIRIITVVQVVFLAIWEIHYIDRSFVYPLTLRMSLKPLPLLVVIAGLAFNIINAYLNSNYIVINTPKYSVLWLYDIRFPAGLALFLLGFIVNRHSDYILYRIRHISRQEYGIPQDGFYRWVSCPNYLGEIFMWIGWTITTWSPVAAAFSLWTVTNLVPRARSHHQWYRQHFVNYPNKRRALVPWIW